MKKTIVTIIVYMALWLGVIGGIKFLFFPNKVTSDFYCVEGYHKGFVTMAGQTTDKDGKVFTKNPDVFGCLSDN